MKAIAARCFILIIISFALLSCNRDDLAVIVDPGLARLSSSSNSITVAVGIHSLVIISGGSLRYYVKHSPNDSLARAQVQGDTLLVYGLGSGMTSVVVADSLDESNSVQVTITIIPSHGWQALGLGVNGFVKDIVVSGEDVYVTGIFSAASGVEAHGIARWDGATWHGLGGGVNGFGLAIAVSGSDVYVGGQFSMAGGIPANNIARWNGVNWTSLGEGINGRVNAVCIVGSDVYVGGDFDSAGSIASRAVACWNGSEWISPGGGIISPDPDKTSVVTSLASVGSFIYAGGLFADLSPCGGPGFMSVWNGLTWQELGGTGCGSIFGSAVTCIVSTNGQLVIGGGFSSVNGVSASCVAQWDGFIWNGIGSGLQTHVYAMASHAADIYAAGFVFTNGGGPYVVRWNGAAWSLMPGEFDGPVWGLEKNDNALYVGGNFTRIGSQSINYLAVWRP